MVGVNDYWHTIAFGSKYQGTVGDYETGYRALIERSMKAIPGVRLVICDPFTFRDWTEYKPYQAVAEKLAEEFKLTFVPFQKKLRSPPKHLCGKILALGWCPSHHLRLCPHGANLA